MIPPDEGNVDYRDYLAWLGEDPANEPAPYEAPPAPVPAAITMRQARLALLAAGHLAAVNTAVTAAGEAARIEWEYATEVRRDNALLAALTPGLGLTPEDLDELFTAGAAL